MESFAEIHDGDVSHQSSHTSDGIGAERKNPGCGISSINAAALLIMVDADFADNQSYALSCACTDAEKHTTERELKRKSVTFASAGDGYGDAGHCDNHCHQTLET